MLKLRRRITLRISDRLAVTAALMLTLTAAGGVLADRYLDAAGQPETAMPETTEKVDPTSDDARHASGLTARLLLFRKG